MPENWVLRWNARFNPVVAQPGQSIPIHGRKKRLELARNILFCDAVLEFSGDIERSRHILDDLACPHFSVFNELHEVGGVGVGRGVGNNGRFFGVHAHNEKHCRQHAKHNEPGQKGSDILWSPACGGLLLGRSGLTGRGFRHGSSNPFKNPDIYPADREREISPRGPLGYIGSCFLFSMRCKSANTSLLNLNAQLQ